MLLVSFGQCCRRSKIWMRGAVGLSVLLGLYFILRTGVRHSAAPNSWIQKIRSGFRRLKMERDSTMENAGKEVVVAFGKKSSLLKLDEKKFNSEQRSRKALLRKQCKNHGSHKISIESTITMVIDPKHKLLFCYIPKVGCIFFARLMMVLKNMIPKAVNPYSISTDDINLLREDYVPEDPKQRDKILQEYRKIMFVRNPYVRLFSGYIDKMFTAKVPLFDLAGYIIKTFRPGSTSAEQKCPIDVSFEELIRYVIHSHTHNTRVERHFQPMHTLCNVCTLDYEVIGKMETFTNDVYFAMDKINQTSRLPKGDFRLIRMEDELRTVVAKSFPMKNNTCMSFGQRLRHVWRRAQIRGFVSRELKFPLTDDEAKTITQKAFLDLIKDAEVKSRKDPMRHTNKRDAMIQLYNKVPMDLLYKLQKLFETDCALFGYDPKPDIIFKRNILRSSSFNYFD